MRHSPFFFSFHNNLLNLVVTPVHQQNGRSVLSTDCPPLPRPVGKPFNRLTAPPRIPPLVLVALPYLSL